jgi:hypothetical protein
VKPKANALPNHDFRMLIAAVLAIDERRMEDEATRIVRAKLDKPPLGPDQPDVAVDTPTLSRRAAPRFP